MQFPTYADWSTWCVGRRRAAGPQHLVPAWDSILVSKVSRLLVAWSGELNSLTVVSDTVCESAEASSCVDGAGGPTYMILPPDNRDAI